MGTFRCDYKVYSRLNFFWQNDKKNSQTRTCKFIVAHIPEHRCVCITIYYVTEGFKTIRFKNPNPPLYNSSNKNLNGPSFLPPPPSVEKFVLLCVIIRALSSLKGHYH